MTLSEKIEKLQRDAHDVTNASLLMAIKTEFIEELVKASAQDKSVESFCREIDQILQGMRIDDIPQQQELYTKYGEARFYLTLQPKLSIQLVPRQAGKKTPDFKLNAGAGDFYGEVKSLLMAGGPAKYNKVLNDGLQSRIDAEQDIKNGKNVGIGEQVIQSHQKSPAGYDPRSVSLVIENLIEKYKQNYKEGQYSMGDTLSMVYLNAHNFPLMSSRIEDAMQAVWFDVDMRVPVTGELWAASFGQIGDLIYRAPEFEGKKNIEGRMTKEGILSRYPSVLALLFLVDHLDGPSVLGCLYRHEDDDKMKSVAATIGAIFNDDKNLMAWKLCQE